jgi:hypothetical protein
MRGGVPKGSRENKGLDTDRANQSRSTHHRRSGSRYPVGSRRSTIGYRQVLPSTTGRAHDRLGVLDSRSAVGQTGAGAGRPQARWTGVRLVYPSRRLPPLGRLKEILDHWGSVGWELTGLIPLRSGRLSATADGVLTPPPPGPPEGLTLVLKRPRAEAGVTSVRVRRQGPLPKAPGPPRSPSPEL